MALPRLLRVCLASAACLAGCHQTRALATGGPARTVTSGDGRLVLVGDWGVPNCNAVARAVARAIAADCGESPCDGAVSLGDNFYPRGVWSEDGPMWNRFERFAGLPVVFAVLGNHDHFPAAPIAQIMHSGTANSSGVEWFMPAPAYVVRFAHLELFVIDTHEMTKLAATGFGGRQLDWLADQLARSDAQFKVVAGHHPLVSFGKYGPDATLALRGGHARRLAELFAAHEVDAYVSGHDHNLQIVDLTISSGKDAPSHEMLQIVSGKGSDKHYDVALPRARTTRFADRKDREVTVGATLASHYALSGFGGYYVLEHDARVLRVIRCFVRATEEKPTCEEVRARPARRST